MTPLIICADDFGLDEAIDAAVIDLAARGRLTATSCLTTSPRWSEAASGLTQELRKQIDVGLHFDLTEFGATVSLSTLVVSSYAHRLPRRELQSRIAAQLDAFEEAVGSPPDYVDGHRHVHQLPQIRSAMLIELERRYARARPWIRISQPPAGSGIKGATIRLLGSKDLARAAQEAGFRSSGRLLGVYGFNLSVAAYERQLVEWLGMAQPCDTLMVHVAQRPPTDDPIGVARVTEYTALRGDRFAAALTTAGVRLARGRDVLVYGPAAISS